jgi:hypothetical protein
MKEMNQEDVRPLAFQLARELNAQEVEAISGGVPQSWPGQTHHPEWRDWHY